MSARWLLNLALAALLLVLAGVILGELQAPRALPRLAESGPLPPRLIEIERPGEPLIRLQANARGQWSLLEPLRTDADAEQIEALLELLHSPVSRSLPIQGLDLPALGLAPPRVWLRVDTLELALGAHSPIGEQRYVAIGDMVHLVDDRFSHRLLAPARELVSRDLLPRDFKPAYATLDDVPLVESMLALLATLRAERIEALARESFASGAARLELRDLNGRSLRFEVSEDRRLWARPELGIAYRLTRAPDLITDPEAPLAEAVMPDPNDPFAPDPPVIDPPAPEATPAPDAPLDPFANPEAPLPGDLPLGPAPSVRLSPDGQIEEEPTDGFGAEPYKEPPVGFGQDPFAPDNP
ncbi:MAG: hypothetical protein JXM75_05295 [Chromatiaceae bacterium]|nr:hypothetical protein [Chromatiaceae bacterium]